jgi:hypothetical protein
MIVRKKIKQLYNLRAKIIYVILRSHIHRYFKNYMVKLYTKNTFKLSSSSKNSNGGRGQIGGKGWIRVN